MNRLIHVGFGNIVNTDKIIAIVSPESAPIKRLVQKAKETGLAIDATQGRRTKSVLVMENSQIVLSALLPETIAGRAQAAAMFAGGSLTDEDKIAFMDEIQSLYLDSKRRAKKFTPKKYLKNQEEK